MEYEKKKLKDKYWFPMDTHLKVVINNFKRLFIFKKYKFTYFDHLNVKTFTCKAMYIQKKIEGIENWV